MLSQTMCHTVRASGHTQNMSPEQPCYFSNLPSMLKILNFGTASHVATFRNNYENAHQREADINV